MDPSVGPAEASGVALADVEEDASPPTSWDAAWQHRDYLLRVARRRVSWDEAEDVVHDAVLRAVRHQLEPGIRLRSWLVTTTVRLCSDRGREETAQRRRRLLLAARPENRVVPSPEDDVCDAAEATWLAKRVASLPDRQREAVELRAQGLSLAEVGAEMGVPTKAVESLLGRARRDLKQGLKQAAAAVVAVLMAVRFVVKRKAQVHIAAAALSTSLTLMATLGVSVANASETATSYGMHQVTHGWKKAAQVWTHHRHRHHHLPTQQQPGGTVGVVAIHR